VGFGLLALSAIPFLYAIRGSRRGLWLAISIVGLSLGSIFFFPAQEGLVSVDLPLAIVTTLAYSAFLWFSARKVLEVSGVRPVHELSGSLGKVSELPSAEALPRCRGTMVTRAMLMCPRGPVK
jgi:hypothetical protein